MSPEPRKNTGNLLLVLTRACQLDCVYCEMDKAGADIERQTVEHAVGLLLDSSASTVELQLFGGEPLLRPGRVRETVEIAERAAAVRGRTLQLTLTTNGILADDSVLEFLRAHGIRVLLSFDGAPATQDRTRPGGQSPESTLTAFARHGIDFFVNMVVGPTEVAEVTANASYLFGLGARELQISPALGVMWPESATRQLEDALMAVLDLVPPPAGPSGGARLMNLFNDAEPVLTFPQVVVDTDGTLYLGCSLVLERTLPDLHRLFRVGPIDEVAQAAELERSRSSQLSLIRRGLAASPDLAIVENNIAVGERVARLMQSARHRHRAEVRP